MSCSRLAAIFEYYNATNTISYNSLVDLFPAALWYVLKSFVLLD